jgi:hypothetical protein
MMGGKTDRTTKSFTDGKKFKRLISDRSVMMAREKAQFISVFGNRLLIQ